MPVGRSVVYIGASASTKKKYVLVDSPASAYQRVPISQFYAPIRLGPPDFDDQLPASTLTFGDFAGGFGKLFPDSRQDANRSWYVNAVDTRFSGIVSLAPKWTSKALPSQPGSVNGVGCFEYSQINNVTNAFYHANGDSLYKIVGTTVTLAATKGAVSDKTHRLRSLVINGTERFMWCRSDAQYTCTGDPTVSANWSSAVGTFSLAATDVADVYQHPTIGTEFVRMLSDGTINLPVAVTSPGVIAGGGHFIGIMAGILYMVDARGNLYAYDPTQASASQLKIVGGTLPNLVGGCVFQGAQLALTDGRSVQLFHPTRPSRDITPGAPDGNPLLMASTIYGLYAFGDRLLALAKLTNATIVALLEYRGGGWHMFSDSQTFDFLGTNSGQELRRHSDANFGIDPVNRRHWLSTKNDALGTTTGLWYNTLPAGGDQPYTQELIAAGDGFESAGVLETGWHAAGLRGLGGPLLKWTCTGHFQDTNQSIVVKYKTDTTGRLDDSVAFTTLGTLTSAAQSLSFASGAGVEFKYVRFRLELARTGGGGGGTSTKSPSASGRLDFLKVPDQVFQRTWQIDIEETRKTRRVSAREMFNQLLALSEQKTLPVVSYEQEGDVFVKLQAPRETAYVNESGLKVGVMVVSGIEPV